MLSYEEVRRQNIERNLKFLQNIGLATENIESTFTTATKKNSIKHVNKTKSEEANNENSSTRKSNRIALMAVPDYTEEKIVGLGEPSNKRSKISTSNECAQQVSTVTSYHEYETSLQDIIPKNTNVNAKLDPTSARNIVAHYTHFLGDNLGKCYSEYGKAPIVSASNSNKLPKFSKYSGTLEWSNCIYLWVNLGSGSNPTQDGYENTFLDNGRSFVWFGCNKMNKETPLTQKMLRISQPDHLLSKVLSSSSSSSQQSLSLLSQTSENKQMPNESIESIDIEDIKHSIKDTTNTNMQIGVKKEVNTHVNVKKDDDDDDNDDNPIENTDDSSSSSFKSSLLNPLQHELVLLFVRLPGEAYCCLGPVEWLSCNFNRHPLVIHWRLLCYNELLNGPHSEQFQRILKTSPTCMS